MEDSHLVDFLLSPLKRVHNMTSELFQGSGLEELKTLKDQFIHPLRSSIESFNNMTSQVFEAQRNKTIAEVGWKGLKGHAHRVFDKAFDKIKAFVEPQITSL